MPLGKQGRQLGEADAPDVAHGPQLWSGHSRVWQPGSVGLYLVVFSVGELQRQLGRLCRAAQGRAGQGRSKVSLGKQPPATCSCQPRHASQGVCLECSQQCCAGNTGRSSRSTTAPRQPRTDVEGADAGLGALQQVCAALQRHLAALRGQAGRQRGGDMQVNACGLASRCADIAASWGLPQQVPAPPQQRCNGAGPLTSAQPCPWP